jgi:hypothetical protein
MSWTALIRGEDGRPGDHPVAAVFPLHRQPGEHLAAGLPGLPPGSAQHVCQQRGLGFIGYPGSSDRRVLIASHKPIMIATAAPLRWSL